MPFVQDTVSDGFAVCASLSQQCCQLKKKEWKYNDSEHWKECTVEGCTVDISESRGVHSSTGNHVATCQKKALCDECGIEYGEKTSCSFTAKVKSEAALKTKVAATGEVVYYYSCSMCGRVATDDKYTFTDHLEEENNPTNNGSETPKENEKIFKSQFILSVDQ